MIKTRLRAHLRARRFDEGLIDRCADEAIGQSIVELSEKGKIIDPVPWVVQRAVWRSIDVLRREEREAPGIKPVDELGDVLEAPSVPLEEKVLGHVEAEFLYQALGTLPADQRRALKMYYFQELSTREGARKLHWSEPTFRRRLKAALKTLRDRFGIEDLEQGDALAIEVGLLAAASISRDPSAFNRVVDQIVGGFDEMRHLVGHAAARVRDLLARVVSSGGAETATAGPAGGAIGRIAGGCAATLGICLGTGIIGPGFGNIDLLHPDGGHKSSVPVVRAESVHRSTPRVVVAPPVPPPPQPRRKATSAGSSKATGGRSGSHEKALGDESGTRLERTRASTEQFGVESTATPPAEESAPAPAPEVSEPAPSPSETSAQQFGP
ncbi:MAG: sigma-70 family RNA polymerase sigma factor [Solirubrobacterales bacterium]